MPEFVLSLSNFIVHLFCWSGTTFHPRVLIQHFCQITQVCIAYSKLQGKEERGRELEVTGSVTNIIRIPAYSPEDLLVLPFVYLILNCFITQGRSWKVRYCEVLGGRISQIQTTDRKRRYFRINWDKRKSENILYRVFTITYRKDSKLVKCWWVNSLVKFRTIRSIKPV